MPDAIAPSTKYFIAAELSDSLGCSLLLAQKVVEDSELFEKA